MNAFADSHRRWGYKRARARSKGDITPSDATRSGASCAARICGHGHARCSSAARTILPGFAHERRGSAAALDPRTRTPPRRESRRRRVRPDPDPDRQSAPGDRTAIQMVTGGRSWDSLTADTDAVTLGRWSPGADGGTQSLADSVVRFCGSRALIGRVGGTGPQADPVTSPLRPLLPLPTLSPAARRSRRASSR